MTDSSDEDRPDNLSDAWQSLRGAHDALRELGSSLRRRQRPDSGIELPFPGIEVPFPEETLDPEDDAPNLYSHIEQRLIERHSEVAEEGSPEQRQAEGNFPRDLAEDIRSVHDFTPHGVLRRQIGRVLAMNMDSEILSALNAAPVTSTNTDRVVSGRNVGNVVYYPNEPLEELVERVRAFISSEVSRGNGVPVSINVHRMDGPNWDQQSAPEQPKSGPVTGPRSRKLRPVSKRRKLLGKGPQEPPKSPGEEPQDGGR